MDVVDISGREKTPRFHAVLVWIGGGKFALGNRRAEIAASAKKPPRNDRVGGLCLSGWLRLLRQAGDLGVMRKFGYWRYGEKAIFRLYYD